MFALDSVCSIPMILLAILLLSLLFNVYRKLVPPTLAPSAPRRVHDVVLPYGVAETVGRRTYMEDRHTAAGRVAGREDCSVYGVFDGHAGAQASTYCAQKLAGVLAKEPRLFADPAGALVATFLSLDADFLQMARARQLDDGTTAIVALVQAGTVYVANAGDSRAILVRSSTVPTSGNSSGSSSGSGSGSGGSSRVQVQAVALSDDHKPNRPDETARIRASGGVVYFHGVWRVGGVLAVSRAIGDRQLKPHVIAQPQVKHFTIGPSDTAVVLATDGLWDVMSNSEAAALAVRYMDPQAAASALVQEALIRGSADNVTALVIDLRGAAARFGTAGGGAAAATAHAAAAASGSSLAGAAAPAPLKGSHAAAAAVESPASSSSSSSATATAPAAAAASSGGAAELGAATGGSRRGVGVMPPLPGNAASSSSGGTSAASLSKLAAFNRAAASRPGAGAATLQAASDAIPTSPLPATPGGPTRTVIVMGNMVGGEASPHVKLAHFAERPPPTPTVLLAEDGSNSSDNSTSSISVSSGIDVEEDVSIAAAAVHDGQGQGQGQGHRRRRGPGSSSSGEVEGAVLAGGSGSSSSISFSIHAGDGGSNTGGSRSGSPMPGGNSSLAGGVSSSGSGGGSGSGQGGSSGSSYGPTTERSASTASSGDATSYSPADTGDFLGLSSAAVAAKRSLPSAVASAVALPWAGGNSMNLKVE